MRRREILLIAVIAISGVIGTAVLLLRPSGPPLISLTMLINDELVTDNIVTVAPGSVLKAVPSIRPGRDPSPTSVIMLERQVQIGPTDEPRFITLTANQPYTLSATGVYMLKGKVTDRDGRSNLAVVQINVSETSVSAQEAAAVVEASNVGPQTREVKLIDVTILVGSAKPLETLGKPAPVLLALDGHGRPVGQQIFADSSEYLPEHGIWRFRFVKTFDTPAWNAPTDFAINFFVGEGEERRFIDVRTDGVAAAPDAIATLKSLITK